MSESLLLVDGSSYLYRAFYALPELKNSKGDHTGAIYGIVSMLRKLLSKYETNYFACIFDAPGKNFRHDICSSYKSNRPLMPQDLINQIDKIYQIIKALGLPVFSIKGVEADDVIGTISDLFSKKYECQVIIATGDKDLAQLVNKKVKLINTMNEEVLDESGVLKKFGVSPSLIIDYLMLIGDSVDNIPGVAKIGPKTALKLLSEFGSVENIIASVDKITGVIGKNIRDFIPNFINTRKLITIKRDCNLSPYFERIEDFKKKSIDFNSLKNLYESLDFSSWLSDLESKDNLSGSSLKNTDVELKKCIVDSENNLSLLLEELHKSKIVTIDLYGSNTSLLQTICFLVNSVVYYIPLYNLASDSINRDDVISRLKFFLEDPNKYKVTYDLKKVLHLLFKEKINLKGVIDDVMLAAYVVDSRNNDNLYKLVDNFLNYKCITYDEVFGKGSKLKLIEEVSIEVIIDFFSQRVLSISQLHSLFNNKLSQDSKLKDIYDIEKKIAIILQVMETNGVKIDHLNLQNQSNFLEKKIINLENEIYLLSGCKFNINSPKQLGEVLFQFVGLPIIRKTSAGLPSTDEGVLSKLAKDFKLARLVLDYRTLTKLKSTYTDKLPKMINIETGRLHTTYSQVSVITGRLSSFDPNLQNIPVRTEEGKLIREAFIAENNNILISADYSQIELRVMAHVSKDYNLQLAFQEGKDVHIFTASEIFGISVDNVSEEQRRIAKTINFGLIYGMSAFGLASNLNIDRVSAQNYINRYFDRYPGVLNYINLIKEKYNDLGYVETVFGRRLYISSLSNKSFSNRQATDRAAINAPIQGTAADLIKKAMISVQDWISSENLNSKLVMQVHDELVLEVVDSEFLIVKDMLPTLMCKVAEFNVPLIVDLGVGYNWSEAH
ncbi:DNA polymerase I [Candidatus Kinetoplastidibacterium crithidiae]|uniref:DNA polymerase I n=1 Tax=Candidatus Kinetoplastidibacterium crithidiae TCC036E TaxID=1208918 RepID=M1LPX3_9PROT|nr:DNA polymerase I [Candidatus Kinetoplastibacterium crithidii]AFZ82647.1 DNA polymerase I [Candidatus Kinetoplastibacterium crithidii (ex Angomonas deanei ATCC 30255)]AGF47692.1 DNA polymerase I [Candidatus Kinetoplastibacterium crithidii TCC036E]